jgi:hypothetical protein
MWRNTTGDTAQAHCPTTSFALASRLCTKTYEQCAIRDISHTALTGTLRQVEAMKEEQANSAESGGNKAEQFRRLAEEAWDIRDRHRAALETWTQPSRSVWRARTMKRSGARPEKENG